MEYREAKSELKNYTRLKKRLERLTDRNKDFLDFSNFEKNALGKEPDWVKDKRKEDKEKSRKYKTTPWTVQEDEKLKYYLKQFKYSCMELSKLLMRTEGAIKK